MKVTEIIKENWATSGWDLLKGLFKVGAKPVSKAAIENFVKDSSERYARALYDAETRGLRPPGLVKFLDDEARKASNGKYGFQDLDPVYTDRAVLDQIDKQARKQLDVLRDPSKAPKDKTDPKDPKGLAKAWKEFKDTPTWKKLWLTIGYVGPIVNGVDAVIAKPYLEYKENMDRVKGWVESGQRPVDAQGNYLDVVDGKQLTPEEWVKYMNHSQARAAYIKSISTLQMTWLDIKAASHLSDSFQSVASIGLLLYFQKFPGVRVLEKYVIAPAILGAISSRANYTADQLKGLPPNSMQAIASMLNLAAIQDTVDGGADYLMDEHKAKTIYNKIIDWINDLMKPSDEKPASQPGQATTQQPEQPGAQAAPAAVAPAQPSAPSVTSSGFPNLIPNSDTNESKMYWTRNYDGTKVKNPRTGLWESNKR